MNAPGPGARSPRAAAGRAGGGSLSKPGSAWKKRAGPARGGERRRRKRRRRGYGSSNLQRAAAELLSPPIAAASTLSSPSPAAPDSDPRDAGDHPARHRAAFVFPEGGWSARGAFLGTHPLAGPPAPRWPGWGWRAPLDAGCHSLWWA